VLFTLVYMITRLVLAVVTVVVRREVSKDVELLVLRHENAVLRRHVKRGAVSACGPDMAVCAGSFDPSASLGSGVRRQSGDVVAVASPTGRLEVDQ
jgi:hypothetical protein